MRAPIAISVLSAAIMSTSQSQALELEEVMVTAQKREQSLQDVPVSINVVSGNVLQEQNLNNLQDMSASTPNITVVEAGANVNMFIRGIGSGPNTGFEQSVATFSDGLYYGRSNMARAVFMDVERIEVLRGPQGVLFGNSAIAGAINIVSRNPGDELEGFVSVSYEDESNERKIEGAISVPITDTLAVRFAARSVDSDGYMKNIVTGKDEVAEEGDSVRLTVAWAPSEDFDLNYKYTLSDYDVEGSPLSTSDCPPSGGSTPGLGCGINLALGVSFDQGFYTKNAGAIAPPWNPNTPAYFEEIYEDIKIESHSLALTYDVPGHTLSSVTGYLESVSDENIDPDQTPLALITVPRTEGFEQWSQELRIQSNHSDTYEYVAGLYYQVADLSVTSGAAYNLSFPGPFGPVEAMAKSNIGTDQETTTMGAFGKYTYHAADNLRASLGVRWTDVEKEVDAFSFMTALDRVSAPSPASYFALVNIFGVDEGDLSETRSFDDTTFDVVVEWDAVDDIMFYARYAQGFKSGGFNTNSIDPDTGFFDPESVDAYELGMKSKLLDGSMTLNAALFRSEYDDLQVSNLDGLTFVTSNAASSISQGLEVDLNWQFAEAWRLDAAVAYLDATYDSFETSECTEAQKAMVSPAPCVQDISGDDLTFAPEYSGRVSLNYSPDLFDGYHVDMVLGVNFTDSFYAAQDLEPNSKIDGYELIDMRVALSPESEEWQVALLGTNLTDEEFLTMANDLPVSAGSFLGLPGSPRAFALQLRYSW